MSMLEWMLLAVPALMGGVAWWCSRRTLRRGLWCWAFRTMPWALIVAGLAGPAGMRYVYGSAVLAAVVVSVVWGRTPVRGQAWWKVAGRTLGALLVCAVVTVLVSLACTAVEIAQWVAWPELYCTGFKWQSREIDDKLPFAVEHRPVHPFLAEYKRRVRFRSGKQADIDMDTGGGSPFAVYRLCDGTYYLVDRLNCPDYHGEYLVDAEGERLWATRPVLWQLVSGDSRTNGSPRAHSPWTLLGTRRFLGRLTAAGEFVEGEEDPFASPANE